jgi:hypothetical protein
MTRGSCGSPKKFKKKNLYGALKSWVKAGSPNMLKKKNYDTKILYGPGGATLPHDPSAAAPIC